MRTLPRPPVPLLRLSLALALLAGWVGLLAAEPRVLHPRYARPGDIEAMVHRLVPKVGVAAMPAQSAVVLNGDEEDMDEAERLIQQIDVPGQVVELEVGEAGSGRTRDRDIGTGIGVRRASGTAGEGEPPPTTLRERTGLSSSRSSQTLMCMPGSPAEVIIGDTAIRDGGPLSPPIETRTGKLVKIENLRVVEGGKAAEMDVTVEDTRPGAEPVVSTGVVAKTSVRVAVGGTRTIAVHQEDTSAGTAESEASGTSGGGRAGRRRGRMAGSTAGSIWITLKGIR